MDIVSNLPFQLDFFSMWGERTACIRFTREWQGVFQQPVTCRVVENEDSYFKFNSEDSEARFYLEAFDGIPQAYNICKDEEGALYRLPSEERIPLFQNQAGFDPLSVDRFQMRVVCSTGTYYGILEVVPKQLEDNEWTIMKRELEADMKHLGQQAVRRQYGNLPSLTKEEWGCLTLVQSKGQRMLSTMQDILERPKYEIQTVHVRTNADRSRCHDQRTVGFSLQRQGSVTTLERRKEVNYDIADNRFLKHFLYTLQKCLQRVWQKVAALADTSVFWLDQETLRTYERSSYYMLQMIRAFGRQNWFLQVEDRVDRSISGSLFMDARYGYLYERMRELRTLEQREFQLPMYSFVWKKSSVLYENWCFLKLCHKFEEDWEALDRFSQCFSFENGVPELQEGCCMQFTRENLLLQVYYNVKLPKSGNDCESTGQPYYMLNSHVQPDMVLHLFERDKNLYLGSMVLECKYRKVNSFWNGSTMSSRGQIMSYWTGAKSERYLGNLGAILDVRPVEKVYVLTPQEHVLEQREQKVCLCTLRPGHEENIQALYVSLMEDIKSCEERRKKLL